MFESQIQRFRQRQQSRLSNAGRVTSNDDMMSPCASPVPSPSCLSPQTRTPAASIPSSPSLAHQSFSMLPSRMSPVVSPTRSLVSTPGPRTPLAHTPLATSSPGPIGTPRAAEGVEQLIQERRERRGAPRTDAEESLRSRGIEPTFVPSSSIRPAKIVLDLSDKPTFVMSPIPPGGNIQCYVTRQKGLYPRYKMFLEEDEIFILGARKRKKNRSVNYLVSIDEDDLARSSLSYIGKLRSSFLSGTFVAYDRGENPGGVNPEKASGLSARQELAHISFTSSKRSDAPRAVRIVLPTIRSDGSRVVVRPFTADQSLARLVESPEGAALIQLRNKVPELDPASHTFQMDFRGRVTMPSIKNFQLVRPGDGSVLLQFGRVGENRFTLDFQFPLSPFQAFSIAIAALHTSKK
eukprot:gnl/Trimastix_PCT/3928.p1 GENE.gnl/Trimastix_PCT/3928~~gnl/Trimastix_PCT/3928.p1  ORF type:complete len:407 (-),score=85.74 gnl/Trimastix_PCT/3928:13-1233(-)